MKKILMLLLVIPMISFSQVSKWRTTPPQQRVQTPTPQRSDVSRWRTQTEPNRPGQEFSKQP